MLVGPFNIGRCIHDRRIVRIGRQAPWTIPEIHRTGASACQRIGRLISNARQVPQVAACLKARHQATGALSREELHLPGVAF
jgi:hypothetical protein